MEERDSHEGRGRERQDELKQRESQIARVRVRVRVRMDGLSSYLGVKELLPFVASGPETDGARSQRLFFYGSI
jgi:hypothetical protein